MHFIGLTDAPNVFLCMPGVALTQRAFYLWEYLLSVTDFWQNTFCLCSQMCFCHPLMIQVPWMLWGFLSQETKN